TLSVCPSFPTRRSSDLPLVGDVTEVVRGLADQEFPPVRDVPQTKLKSGADLVLYVSDEGRKQPLLATWLYGLGRAAAFPFDPMAPEAGGWSAWPGFAKLWSQLVRWAIREEAPWEIKQAVRFRDRRIPQPVDRRAHRPSRSATGHAPSARLAAGAIGPGLADRRHRAAHAFRGRRQARAREVNRSHAHRPDSGSARQLCVPRHRR